MTESTARAGLRWYDEDDDVEAGGGGDCCRVTIIVTLYVFLKQIYNVVRHIFVLVWNLQTIRENGAPLELSQGNTQYRCKPPLQNYLNNASFLFSRQTSTSVPVPLVKMARLARTSLTDTSVTAIRDIQGSTAKQVGSAILCAECAGLCPTWQLIPEFRLEIQEANLILMRTTTALIVVVVIMTTTGRRWHWCDGYDGGAGNDAGATIAAADDDDDGDGNDDNHDDPQLLQRRPRFSHVQRDGRRSTPDVIFSWATWETGVCRARTAKALAGISSPSIRQPNRILLSPSSAQKVRPKTALNPYFLIQAPIVIQIPGGCVACSVVKYRG